VVFGGKIIEQKNNPGTSRTNLSNKNFELLPTNNEYRITIGGRAFYNSKSEWLKSLEHDPETWKIIKYRKVAPIFDLLSKNDEEEKTLRQKQKLKKLKFSFKPLQIKPYVYPLNMDFIPNLEKHQIFPTILNKRENIDVFGLRLDYLDDKSPAIILHRTYKIERQRNYELEVLWIVIGYLNDFKIKDFNPDIDIESVLGTCVIDRGVNSAYASHESTIVTGIHFREQENACVFLYDLESCARYKPDQNLLPLKNLNIHYCVLKDKVRLNSNQLGKTPLTLSSKNIDEISIKSIIGDFELTMDHFLFLNYLENCTDDSCNPIILNVNVLSNDGRVKIWSSNSKN
ncbi:13546_t:CDS:2, partial [Acaulospora morrowiae]